MIAQQGKCENTELKKEPWFGNSTDTAGNSMSIIHTSGVYLCLKQDWLEILCVRCLCNYTLGSLVIFN